MRVFATVMTFASVAFAGLVTRQSPLPVPAVTYPHDRTTAVWVIGWRHNVTWESAGVSGNNANILLAKAGVVDSGHPLSSGFPLEAGRVEVTTPNVTPGSDYQVVLNRDGQSTFSAPFIIARSKSEVPGNSPGGTGVTTIVFPSTTIVATVTGPLPAPSAPVSGVVPSISEGASSVISSLSAGASSVQSSISAVQSGLSQSLSSALSSATNSSPSGTNGSEAGNAATILASDFNVAKALVTVGAIALSAGAVLVF